MKPSVKHPLHELSWLPRPASKMRDALASLPSDPLQALARRKGIGEIAGRYIPTARNALVRDHFSKLGFVQTGNQADGETIWKLDVGAYSETELPFKVDTSLAEPTPVG